MERKVLLVDVDQTVVNSAYGWWKWLEAITGEHIPYKDVYHYYDYREAYQPYLSLLGVDGLDYWRSDTLYDSLSPMEGSVECLRWFDENGWDVVFCSAIKGWHNKSKYTFLKRYFPFMKGYVATKEKNYCRADAIIDDRNEFLNLFDEKVIKVRYNTPHRQTQNSSHPVLSCWDVDELRKLLKVERDVMC